MYFITRIMHFNLSPNRRLASDTMWPSFRPLRHYKAKQNTHTHRTQSTQDMFRFLILIDEIDKKRIEQKVSPTLFAPYPLYYRRLVINIINLIWHWTKNYNNCAAVLNRCHIVGNIKWNVFYCVIQIIQSIIGCTLLRKEEWRWSLSMGSIGLSLREQLRDHT